VSHQVNSKEWADQFEPYANNIRELLGNFHEPFTAANTGHALIDSTLQDNDVDTSGMDGDQRLVAAIDILNSDDNRSSREYNERLEAAQEAIQEAPLAVYVRSGWVDLSEGRDESSKYSGDATRLLEPEEFMIHLTTGGPDVRITGKLDDNRIPVSARMQVQDWGTQIVNFNGLERDAALEFAQQFCFE